MGLMSDPYLSNSGPPPPPHRGREHGIKNIPSWQPANHTSRTSVTNPFSSGFLGLTGVSHLLIGKFISKGCEGSHILVFFFKLEGSFPCEVA